MKRSDFLAIIPSIAALPLIGKEIIQKPDRIEIYQPEEVKNFTKQIKSADTYLALVKNGNIVGYAYITQFNVMPNYNQEVSIEAQLIGPITAEMVESTYEIFKNPMFP